MSALRIRGWRPGAHRPMRLGSGLAARVWPRGDEIAPLALAGRAAAHGPGAVGARSDVRITGAHACACPPLRVAGLWRSGGDGLAVSAEHCGDRREHRRITRRPGLRAGASTGVRLDAPTAPAQGRGGGSAGRDPALEGRA